MSQTAPTPGTKTLADWLALPDDSRFELIDGELFEKAMPTVEHGVGQARTASQLGGAYGCRVGGPGGPGGWWIATEVDIVLNGRGFRPDVLGWRRERMPVLAKVRPIELCPDWICEIVSESNRTTDTVKKLRAYHQGGVPFYWILDQLDRTLTVFRHTADGYLVLLRAEAAERVRAAPFEQLEVHVAELLGDDV